MNIDFNFFNEYKQVDKICSEMYDVNNGVSAYIENMETCDKLGRNSVHNWYTYYKTLKHLRWVRNKIAHEVDGGPYATDLDLQNLKQFHSDLIKQRDPLAQLNKSNTNKSMNIVKSTNNGANATHVANPNRKYLAYSIVLIILFVLVFLLIKMY